MGLSYVVAKRLLCVSVLDRKEFDADAHWTGCSLRGWDGVPVSLWGDLRDPWSKLV